MVFQNPKVEHQMVPKKPELPVLRKGTGHEATAFPICATCFRHYQIDTAAPCCSPRPCQVVKCENTAAYWAIDTK